MINPIICLLLTFFVASGLFAAEPSARPKRVVSMNLCTDQMAMALSDPSQLISVSYISNDMRLSPYFDLVDQYQINHGQAEEIFALEPDLVLVDPYSDPLVVGLLRDLGVNVVAFQSANRITEIASRVREMGELLGQEERAEAIARDFENGLNALMKTTTHPARAAIFGANGYSAGTQTLSGDIVSAAGLKNLADDLGIVYGGNISLETLTAEVPDYLITSPQYEGASNAEAIMAHPVIQHLQASGNTSIVESSANWSCGTPRVLDAVRILQRQTQSKNQ